MDGFDFVVGLNPVVRRGKDASPNMDKYNEYDSTKRAKILKQRLDPPAVSKVTKAGNLEKLTIEETEGWTIDPFVEGQEVLIVAHFEPTFASNYCSPELRLDHVYMLPIEPAAFEWPEHVTSAVHFGGNNAEQHTQQEAKDRATNGLLAARWSFRSCLALSLWRSRFG